MVVAQKRIKREQYLLLRNSSISTERDVGSKSSPRGDQIFPVQERSASCAPRESHAQNGEIVAELTRIWEVYPFSFFFFCVLCSIFQTLLLQPLLFSVCQPLPRFVLIVVTARRKERCFARLALPRSLLSLSIPYLSGVLESMRK